MPKPISAAEDAAGDLEARRRQRRCRQQVWVYIAVTLALSFAYESCLIRAGGILAWGAIGPLALMWIPAGVSLLMRMLYREGFGDVGWRVGQLRYWAWAYFGPVACAAVTYSGAWIAGAVAFGIPPALAAEIGTQSPVAAWAISSALAASAGFAIGWFFSMGEELGWRGYLLTRLVEARIPAPLWASGLIWSVWHLPLILWGGYASSELPWLSALLFTVCISFAGVFVGWLRLASGSVWPAVIMHTAHNAYYQSVFDPWFNGPSEAYFAGEAGVFSILAYGLLVLWLWRSGRLRSCLLRPRFQSNPKAGR